MVKKAALGREQFGLEFTAERLGANGARLGQDLTHGEVLRRRRTHSGAFLK
jgi:hypothetical protein